MNEEVETLKGNSSREIKMAEAAAESINKGSYAVHDTHSGGKNYSPYVFLKVYLPGIGKVYVKFDMEIEIIETPYYKPATMYRSNGDPGDPDEGSDGELKFNLKEITIYWGWSLGGKSTDFFHGEEQHEVVFKGMNDSLKGAFETITDGGEIYDRVSESFWSDWNENQQDDRDDDDYRYSRGEEY